MTTLRCAIGSHKLELVTTDEAECKRRGCDLHLYRTIFCHCNERFCDHWSPLRPVVNAPPAPPAPERVYPPEMVAGTARVRGQVLDTYGDEPYSVDVPEQNRPIPLGGRHRGAPSRCQPHGQPDCVVCWPPVDGADYDGSTWP